MMNAEHEVLGWLMAHWVGACVLEWRYSRLATPNSIIHIRSPSRSWYHGQTMKAIRENHERGVRRGEIFCAALGALVLIGGCADLAQTQRAWTGSRLYSAGTRSLEAGDAAGAVASLARAAELVPHASEIQNHLGLAYWALGDWTEAVNAFDRALELDCENAAARSNRDGLLAAEAAGRGNAHGG